MSVLSDVPASSTDVRRRKTRPQVRHEQAAGNLRAGDDRGRQSGDAVGRSVAVQLQQIGLHRVERVDASRRR